MSEEQSIQPPAIGEAWLGQGGIYGGIRQYDEGLCYIIFAADDLPDPCEYGDYGVFVGATNRFDGRINTNVLLASTGLHPAAIAASSYTADGQTDFYLPSAGELHHGWQFVPELFTSTYWYYWSSTQYSMYAAYYMIFTEGWLSSFEKSSLRLVRPVRRVPIQ